jgi:ABC-type Fe3+/spermidine/putrescine transport system ATPase subunit
MNEGRVEQVGAGPDVYGRPANRFVADFIGATNFVPVRVLSVDAGVAVTETVAEGAQRLRAQASGDVVPGTGFTLSARPEHMRLAAPTEPAGESNCIAGVIVDTTYLGATVEYRVRAGSGPDLLVVEPSGSGSGRMRPGAEVSVVWSVEDSWLLSE